MGVQPGHVQRPDGATIADFRLLPLFARRISKLESDLRTLPSVRNCIVTDQLNKLAKREQDREAVCECFPSIGWYRGYIDN